MTEPSVPAGTPAIARDVKSLIRAELEAQFAGWGEPAYRVNQLLDWLYRRQATSWEAMTNLPLALRQRLAATFSLRVLERVADQGAPESTRKFLWRLSDGALIESVLIPANPAWYGDASDRRTLCVSTQVGCAYGCEFCASGMDGWKRNLTADEIVEQVMAVERHCAGERAGDTAAETPETPAPVDAIATKNEIRWIHNLVVMGMGEPLANYAPLMQALRILNAPWGGRLGARKITISTCGLAPQIRQLAQEPEQFRLAISLHGATDGVRNRLMPVNRKYPLKDLVSACDYYVQRKGRMIAFEFLLIEGINDSEEQARLLGALARRLQARINLIPCNPVAGLRWRRPTEAVQQRFLSLLRELEVVATLRLEKGADIDAACGQLRLRTERSLSR